MWPYYVVGDAIIMKLETNTRANTPQYTDTLTIVNHDTIANMASCARRHNKDKLRQYNHDTSMGMSAHHTGANTLTKCECEYIFEYNHEYNDN